VVSPLSREIRPTGGISILVLTIGLPERTPGWLLPTDARIIVELQKGFVSRPVRLQ
jgi:hypothetical protein